MIDRYAWRRGEEAMLRFGPASGPVVIVASPLFEEANRTRALLVAVCRGLAERGLASALPDLPGMGESPVETRDARLADWRSAFAAAAEFLGGFHDRVLGFSVRGGTLVYTESVVECRYAFAPIDGAGLVRDLERSRLTGSGPPLDRMAQTVEMAGNLVSRQLLDELREAQPMRADRTVRLAIDPLPADLKVDAAPLWRRAEPANDPILATCLSNDIAAWVRACAG